jgi:hypothetical protein
MKTPEEIAYEYGEKFDGVEISKNDINIAWYDGYQAAAPQWISVKDRLPDRNEPCLVNTEWRGVVVAQYGWESWVFDEGQGYCEKALSYAPHWMPLPQPPKEEEK